jgi:HlyD family secretion protein
VLKLLGILLAAAVVALAGWLYVRGAKPPVVPVARASQGPLESSVTTNGKTEPVEWSAARTDLGGIVTSVAVTRGQKVSKGQTIAVIEARQAKADLATAEARIAQAEADLQTLRAGGKSGEIAEIESGIQRAQLDRDVAQRDLESLTRLQAKNAATKTEVQEASDRLARAQAQIQAFTAKRKAMVSRGEVASAEARLREAQAAAALARQTIAVSVVRSPLDGVVYQLEVRPGAYLEAGAVAAGVGKIDRVRVIVYVDEPELGRVRKGMPVTITWDALPNRQWKGEVERVPTQIVALGTRQVGEVTSLIDNADGTLLPGTNINATIQSESVANAIRIPKEGVVREGGQTGVWVVESGKVKWRPVKLGIANITTVQIVDGLKNGEEVALPSDLPLQDGAPITPDRRSGDSASR